MNPLALNCTRLLEVRSEIDFVGPNQGASRASFLFLEALGENPFSRLFQLLEASCISWLMAPSSPFTAHSSELGPSQGDLFCLPLPFFNTCNYITATHIVQDNLPSLRSAV